MLISIEFLLTSLIVIISPGTGAIYTIAMGLSRGTAMSLLAAVGCTFVHWGLFRICWPPSRD